ncbi:hypothetical protein MMC25_007124 [Agyrium rufum]|nr:hypothetical protein [Agyrium rufum]
MASTMISWLMLAASVSTVDAFYPYKINHSSAKAKEAQKSVNDYIQQGFSYPGTAQIATPESSSSSRLAIRKLAVKPHVHPRERSIAELHHRHAGLHSPSRTAGDLNGKRDNVFTVPPAPAPSQSDSLAIQEDGTDFSYFSTLNFGSNNTPLILLLDSGAANTWVMGSDCKSVACGTHTTYGPSDSSTLETTSETFAFAYGSGTVGGNVVTDTVSFAGNSIKLSFGSANTTSDTFNNYPMDGILGLGRDKSNQLSSATFMETATSDKIFSSKLFGISLQRESTSGDMLGEINFGAPDTTKYKGDLSWTTTVSDQVYWEIPADDITIDSKSAGLSGRTAIIDSGTSYVLIPPDDSAALHKLIPGAVAEDNEIFNIPCDTEVDVQFVFSKVGYSVSPKDYVGIPVPGNSAMCASRFVGVSGAGPGQWIVGDVFLKNIYAVYDFDNERMGFGTMNPSTSPSSSASSTPASASSTAALIVASSPTPSSSSPSSSSISLPTSSDSSLSSTSSVTATSPPSASSVAPFLPPSMSTTDSTLLPSSTGTSSKSQSSSVAAAADSATSSGVSSSGIPLSQSPASRTSISVRYSFIIGVVATVAICSLGY